MSDTKSPNYSVVAYYAQDMNGHKHTFVFRVINTMSYEQFEVATKEREHEHLCNIGFPARVKMFNVWKIQLMMKGLL